MHCSEQLLAAPQLVTRVWMVHQATEAAHPCIAFSVLPSAHCLAWESSGGYESLALPRLCGLRFSFVLQARGTRCRQRRQHR